MQVSTKIPLGGILSPVSVYNGPQYAIRILVFKVKKKENMYMIEEYASFICQNFQNSHFVDTVYYMFLLIHAHFVCMLPSILNTRIHFP